MTNDDSSVAHAMITTHDDNDDGCNNDDGRRVVRFGSYQYNWFLYCDENREFYCLDSRYVL